MVYDGMLILGVWVWILPCIVLGFVGVKPLSSFQGRDIVGVWGLGQRRGAEGEEGGRG